MKTQPAAQPSVSERLALSGLVLLITASFAAFTSWPSVSVSAQAPTGSASAVPLIISEFRLRGPNGPNDEFVEIYNNSDSPHTVNSLDGTSSGYALVGSSNAVINDSLVATRFVIPNGTVIPARAHLLATNSLGYSLNGYPAGNGTTATGDITYTTQIPDNVGLALFGTSVPFNYILANRIDAVGSSGFGESGPSNSFAFSGPCAYVMTASPAVFGAAGGTGTRRRLRKRPGGWKTSRARRAFSSSRMIF